MDEYDAFYVVAFDKQALPGALLPYLGFVLNQAAQQVGDAIDQALESYGIKARQYGILSLIAHSGPLSQIAIGRQLRIDRTTMVYLIDELEALTLAQRKRASHDRRAYTIALMPKGEQVLGEAKDAVARAEASFLSSLTPDERDQLARLLSHLIR